MADTLAQTVEIFIEKEYRRNKKGKTTAANLLMGSAKPEYHKFYGSLR